jgi:NADPH-dependent 2,4-dienoyl-CoA reductase/sulfur reductase-like enzyme
VGKKYLIAIADLERFCRQEGIDDALVQQIAGTRPQAPPVPATPISINANKEVPMSAKPLGSVLVVGGGIAGMQATLDLANAGYAVHLIEKSAGIGGVMAQLDKTYPTNDCAM